MTEHFTPMPWTRASLIEDCRFAEANMAEFNNRISPMIRYIAAINPEIEKADFVRIVSEYFGFDKRTIGQRFAESRRFDERENNHV